MVGTLLIIVAHAVIASEDAGGINIMLYTDKSIVVGAPEDLRPLRFIPDESGKRSVGGDINPCNRELHVQYRLY